MIRFKSLLLLLEIEGESVALRAAGIARFKPAFREELTGQVIVTKAGWHNIDELPEPSTAVYYWEDGFLDSMTGEFLSREEVSELLRDVPQPNKTQRRKTARNMLIPNYNDV